MAGKPGTKAEGTKAEGAEADDGRQRPTSYASPQILARRRRILEETRTLIAEQGLAAFSMDDLCVRAGVAKRTLYNAFQNKDHMIAVAIHEYFDAFASRLQFANPPGTLEYMVERIAVTVGRNLQLLNYNRALMAIYHSPDVSHDIWATIHQIATESHAAYVRALKARRQLQPWADADELIENLARYRYAAANDWCNGRIPDAEYLGRVLAGMLTMLIGATRGAARREIEALLAVVSQAASPSPQALAAALRRGKPLRLEPSAEG